MVLSLADTEHARLLPSQDEMRSFDQRTIKSGISSAELMERAGTAVFHEIKERFSFELYSSGKIVIFSGPGNNGGDGLVIARHLKDHGYDVVVVLVSHSSYGPVVLGQITQFLQKQGVIFQYPHSVGDFEGAKLEVINDEQIVSLINNAALVIDALMGTGQKAAPRGMLGDLLALVKETLESCERRPKVIAVDTPTGINGDTGAVFANALHADLTVAVELVKRGMIQYPARRVCGEIWSVPIGLQCEGAAFSLIDRAVLPQLEPRKEESHKGNFGSVFIIGGSEDLPGAPMLSARASLRLGAGSVVKAHLRGTPVVEMPAELMLLNVGESDRQFSIKHMSFLESALANAHVTVLGPGIGTHPETKELVKVIVEYSVRQKKPLVIDADALNCLAQLRVSGEEIICSGSVLTPHPGEMGRLLGISTAEVQSDRYAAALRLAELTDATIVLKGASTIIAKGKGGWVNTTGNPWLAVPGSGDVLAGIIAAFVAQGLSIGDATQRAVAIHGMAGDVLQQQGRVPCTANDIILAAAPLAHG